MPKYIPSWEEIESSEDYTSLDTDRQSNVRSVHFDDIATRDHSDVAPDKITQAKQSWMEDFKPSATSITPDKPEPIEPLGRERGLGGDILHAIAKGAPKSLEMMGKGVSVLDLDSQSEGGVVDEVGAWLEGLGKKLEKSEIMRPDISEVAGTEGYVKRKTMEGLSALVPSATPIALGIGAAGAAAIGAAAVGVSAPVAAIGAAVGTGAMAIQFGLGTFKEKMDELAEKRPDLPISERRKVAAGHGAIEFGGELVSDVLAAFTGGAIGKVATQQAVKGGVKSLVTMSAKGFAKRYGITLLPEWATETGQMYAQSRLDEGVGIGDAVSLFEAAKETAIPTLVMHSVFSGGAYVGNEALQRKTISDLNSEDPEIRTKAYENVLGSFEEEDADLAEAWQNYAGKAIQEEKPIAVDYDFSQEKAEPATAEIDIKQAEDFVSGMMDMETHSEVPATIEQAISTATPEARKMIIESGVYEQHGLPRPITAADEANTAMGEAIPDVVQSEPVAMSTVFDFLPTEVQTQRQDPFHQEVVAKFKAGESLTEVEQAHIQEYSEHLKVAKEKFAQQEDARATIMELEGEEDIQQMEPVDVDTGVQVEALSEETGIPIAQWEPGVPVGGITSEQAETDFSENVTKALGKGQEADAILSLVSARAKTLGLDTGEYIRQRGLSVVADAEGNFDAKLIQDAKGGVDLMTEGKAVISAFKKADVSTFVHEIGHVFRKELTREELAVADKWAGVKTGEVWGRSNEEKFSRAWENYIATGKAPNAELKSLFDKFTVWMKSIYAGIKGTDIDVNVSTEMRKLFDGLISREEVAPAEFKKDVKAVEEIAKEDPHRQAMAEAVNIGGISIKSAKQMFSADTYNELRKPGLFTKDGQDIDDIATQLGYEDAKELVDSWTKTPLKKEAVAGALQEQQDEFDRAETARQDVEGVLDEEGVLRDSSGKELFQGNVHVLFQGGEGGTGFKRWTKGMEPLEGYELDTAPSEPFVAKVHHGTTHKFSQFDPTITGSKEGAFGAVNYFTSDHGDADINYAGEGPDLTNRIERLAEQIESGSYPEHYNIDQGAADAAEGNPIASEQLATEALAGEEPTRMDVYVRLDNPVFLNGDTTTFIDNDIREQYREDAVQEMRDVNDATDEEIADGEYDDQIDEFMAESAMYDETPINEAIDKALRGYDVESYDGSDVAYEPEPSATDLYKELKESMIFIEDPDTGDLVSSHVIGKVFQNLGFDGIVLQNADQQFPNMNMGSGTSHVHVFGETPSQIKSQEQDIDTGTFGETGDILLQADVKTVQPLTARDLTAKKRELRDVGFYSKYEEDTEGSERGIRVVLSSEVPAGQKRIPGNIARKNFKEWFKGSLAVDKDGKPQTWFHGSPTFGRSDDPDSWAFDQSRKGENVKHPFTGLGMTFTPHYEMAKTSARGGQVTGFNLQLRNPYVLTKDDMKNLSTYSKAEGHTAKSQAFLNRKMGLGDFDSVYDPNTGFMYVPNSVQSKELRNIGTYSEAEENVLFQTEKRTNTEKVNNQGSTGSAAKGRVMIEKIMRDLRLVSTTKAEQVKYTPAKERKHVEAFLSLKNLAVDPHASVASKQKMLASFIGVLPPKVAKKMATKLAFISRYKGTPVHQKRLDEALTSAEKFLNQHLRRTISQNIKSGLKPTKLAKNRIKKSTLGHEATRDLEYIRLAVDDKDAGLRAHAITEKIVEAESKLEEIDTEVKRAIQEDLIADLRAKQGAYETFGDLRSQNLDDLVAAKEDLKSLIADGRSTWRATQDYWKDTFAQNNAILHRDIAGVDDPTVETVSAALKRKAAIKTLPGQVKKFGNWVDNSILSWEFVVDKVAGKSGKGTLQSKSVELFGSQSADGSRKNNAYNLESKDQLHVKALELMGAKDAKQLNKKWNELSNKQDNKIHIYPNGNKTPILVSPLEMAYWYAIRKNADSIPTWNEHGITEQTFQEIESYMGKDLIAWTDYVVDEFLQDFHYPINEVYRAINGVNLTKTPGYITWKREITGKEQDAGFASKAETGAGGMTKGAHKQRVANTKMFQVADLNSVLMNHVYDMNNYRAWAVPSKVINGSFNNGVTQKLIVQHTSMDTLKAVKSFQSDFAKSPHELRGDLPWLDKMRGNITTAMVGMNPTIFLKQQTSIPAMMESIPTASWLKYSGHFWANPRKAMRTLLSSTEFKARRDTGMERDIRTAQTLSGSEAIAGAATGVRKAAKMSMFMVKAGDSLAVIIGGYPVYLHHYNKNKSNLGHAKAHDIAIRKFEMAMDRTQQASGIKDQGRIQRGGSYAKLFTMFMTTPAAYTRNITSAIRNFSSDPRDSSKRLFIFGVLMPALFSATASGFLGLIGGDEEDKEAFWGEMAGAIGMSLGNGIPIIRDLQTGVWNAAMGAWYGSDLNLSPAFESGQSLIDIVQNGARYFKEDRTSSEKEDDLVKTVNSLADFVGFNTGIPVQPMRRWLWQSLLQDIPKGETEAPFRRALGYSRSAMGESRGLYSKYTRSVNEVEKAIRKGTPEEREKAQGSDLMAIRGYTKGVKKRISNLSSRAKKADEMDDIERVQELELQINDIKSEYIDRYREMFLTKI